MMQTKFKITNMDCEACVKLTKMALGDIPGVTNILVDLKTGEGSFDSEGEIAWADVEAALKEVGKNVVKL